MNRFDYNELVDEELKNDPRFRAAFARQTAGPIADEVRRIALAEAYDEGDYYRGISVDATPDGRAWARVNADDFKSHWIEWGTRYHIPEAPMRRAAETMVGSSRLRGGN